MLDDLNAHFCPAPGPDRLCGLTSRSTASKWFRSSQTHAQYRYFSDSQDSRMSISAKPVGPFQPLLEPGEHCAGPCHPPSVASRNLFARASGGFLVVRISREPLGTPDYSCEAVFRKAFAEEGPEIISGHYSQAGAEFLEAAYSLIAHFARRV